MNANELIAELQKLSPEQRELEVVHTLTEYGSPEDSMGYEVDKDIDNVRISTIINSKRRGCPVISVGY